jgi:hypothetical protein
LPMNPEYLEQHIWLDSWLYPHIRTP